MEKANWAKASFFLYDLHISQGNSGEKIGELQATISLRSSSMIKAVVGVSREVYGSDLSKDKYCRQVCT